MFSIRSWCYQASTLFWASTGSLTKFLQELIRDDWVVGRYKMKCGSMFGVTLIDSAHLSLKMVQSSPPRHASISMYRYLLSLNVRYNLNTNRKECPYWVLSQNVYIYGLFGTTLMSPSMVMMLTAQWSQSAPGSWCFSLSGCVPVVLCRQCAASSGFSWRTSSPPRSSAEPEQQTNI